MSEEITTNEELELVEVESEETDSNLSLEDALKALSKTRKEAAKHRVEKNSLKEKADAYDVYLASQKTELERIADEKAKLAEENAELKVDKLRNEVIKAAKIDPELAVFITGKTEAEMKAQAKVLADKFGETKPSGTDFFAGQRGKAIKPAPENASEGQLFFNQLWEDSERKVTKTVF